MVELKVYDKGSVKSTDVDASLFGSRVLGRTLKDAVVMYEANLRQGTAQALTRAMVRGGNKKLWPQKHTGRARMGTTKSPLWKGGGRTHPPAPLDHSFQMPKKARRVALRNALFTKFQDGEAAVADGWPTDKPSTKAAHGILGKLGMERSTTVVTDKADRNLWLSLRNVPLVDVFTVDDLNARQVLLRRWLVMTPAALEAIKQRFGTGAASSKTASKTASKTEAR